MLLLALQSCQTPLNNEEPKKSPENKVTPVNKETTSNIAIATPSPSITPVAVIPTPIKNASPSPEPKVVDNNSDIFPFEKQKLNFDTPPPESAEIEPGTIIVFYHNKDKFRVRTTESVSSVNTSYQEQINKILVKYKVKILHSFGYYDPADAKKVICKGEHFDEFNADHPEAIKFFEEHKTCDTMNYTDSEVTIKAIEKEQQLISQNFEGEFTDKLSIHIYEFPENADTRAIARELRALPFVRNAYPEVKSGTASSSTKTEPVEQHLQESGEFKDVVIK